VTIPPPLTDRLNRVRNAGILLAVIGGAACLGGWMMTRERFYAAWLTAWLYWLELSLGALGIALIHGMSGGGWGRTIRRVVEAAFQTVPLMALLFVPIWLNVASIYPWADPEFVHQHELLVKKSEYLNVSGFQIRALIYFGIWLAVMALINRFSPNDEQFLDSPRSRRLQRVSGFGFVALGFTMTLAAVDWVMSLEPEWYSTMYGLIHLAGEGVSGLAGAIVVVVALREFPPWSRTVTPSRLNDLGNLLLASVMFWAYCSFFQYLVIWSGNLPEENVWYVHRSRHGWQYLALGLALLHFAVPFLLLLSRQLKRQPVDLARIAGLLLVMRYADLYWTTVPGFDRSKSESNPFSVHWLDLAAFVAIGGAWLAVFAWRLSVRASVPLFDPETTDEVDERHCAAATH